MSPLETLTSFVLTRLYSSPALVLRKIQKGTPRRQSKEPSIEAREMEHQTGRFSNMSKIASMVAENGNRGDVVEFGTFRGLGLVLLIHAFQATGESPESHARVFWGVDSFEGLPSSSTVWRAGTFSNTNVSRVEKFVARETSLEFRLLKGRFDDQRVRNTLEERVQSVAVIHFDADLGVSTKQALQISEKWVLSSSDGIYFLFDDWGNHPDEVPKAFREWLADLRSRGTEVRAVEVASTQLTRYFFVNSVRS